MTNPLFKNYFKVKKDFNKDKKSVVNKKILFTGGPCAGKSSSIFEVAEDLSQRGYMVFLVPEAATLLMKGGAMIDSNVFS